MDAEEHRAQQAAFQSPGHTKHRRFFFGEPKKIGVLKDGVVKSDLNDPAAGDWWVCSLVLSIICIIIFQVSGVTASEEAHLKFYLIMALGNICWTLLCVRKFIKVPYTRLQRIFCLLFDMLVIKPWLRNHIILAVVCFLGFLNTSFFTLLLLDIMNNSPVLR